MAKKDKGSNGCLRLAFLGHKSIPSRQGGVEIVVEELTTRIAALEYDVTCYNRRGHHVSGKEFDDVTENLEEYKNLKIKWIFTIEAKGLATRSSSVFAASFGKYNFLYFHDEGLYVMA